jgi:hypothetical protein
MDFKKLFAIAFMLVGVYNHSHSMDKKAWQANLYQAILNGDVERLKACIAQDTTFNPEAQYEVEGYALPKGRFFVNLADIEGMGQTVIKEFFPLHLACEHNQLAVVRYFVEEHHVVINQPANSDSALLLALNNYHWQIVEYLLSKGAQVDPVWIASGEAALQAMAEDNPGFNSLQRMLYLLKGGKIVCGVPMTRLNVGMMIAGVAVCAAAGKYFYDRYCAAQKKSALDDDEVNVHDENDTTHQKEAQPDGANQVAENSVEILK